MSATTLIVLPLCVKIASRLRQDCLDIASTLPRHRQRRGGNDEVLLCARTYAVTRNEGEREMADY
jgi:hypothetical protein